MLPHGIHHVGVAVDDLEAAVDTYAALFGAVVEHRDTLEHQGVVAVSLRLGTSRVELLEPTTDESPVARFLTRRGPGMHHIAYEVDDVAAAIASLEASGALLVDTQPRPGLFGLEVAFVHPDAVHGVLTEVVSSARH